MQLDEDFLSFMVLKLNEWNGCIMVLPSLVADGFLFVSIIFTDGGERYGM